MLAASRWQDVSKRFTFGTVACFFGLQWFRWKKVCLLSARSPAAVGKFACVRALVLRFGMAGFEGGRRMAYAAVSGHRCVAVERGCLVRGLWSYLCDETRLGMDVMDAKGGRQANSQISSFLRLG